MIINVVKNLLIKEFIYIEKKIIEKYGVWGEKNMYGRKYMGLFRTTFLIDENGLIFKIFKKPNSKVHSTEILKEISFVKK